jgi:hypothetical protein
MVDSRFVRWGKVNVEVELREQFHFLSLFVVKYEKRLGNCKYYKCSQITQKN